MINHINILDKDYIGKGLHRICYEHPSDSTKCIKINYNSGAEVETRREINYYRHLIKRNINWHALSLYYGEVETNLGKGQMFELLRDADGNISLSLEHYLANSALTTQYYDQLLNAFKWLKHDLLANRIITMTIKSKNILFQRQDNHNSRLVIIDNIGNSDFFPIANYLPSFAKAKIKRKWQGFLTAILKENANNKAVQKLVNDLFI